MGGEAFAGELLVWAAGTVVRATLVLAGAFALAGLMHRASASVHHALWTVTLAALLALPALPLILPRLPVPLPEGWLPEAPVVVDRTPAAGGEAREAGHAPAEAGYAPAAARGPAEAPPASEAARSEAATSAAATSDTARPEAWALEPGWLLLLWSLGTGALGVSLGLGLWRSTRIWRGARPTRDDAWLRDLDDARAAVGMRRPVSLRFSPGVRTGMAGGLLRSLVLLPDTARTWDTGRREMVLLHEVVHLSRRDPLRKVLGRLTLALYWFHPLAWWAARSAALAREEACDEAVVALGHRPSTYARHLLDLADPARLPLPALARVDRPLLEKRIMRLLRSPSASSSRTVASAAVLALGWAVLVAAVTPTAHPGDTRVPAQPLPGAAPAVVEPPSEPLPGAAPAAAELPSEPLPSGLLPGPAHPGLQASPVAPPTADTTDACRPLADGPGFADGDRFGIRGRGVVVTESGDWFIQRSVADVVLCLRSHGTERPETLRPGALELPEGSWLVLAARGEAVSQRLVIVPGPSGPEHSWFVNGRARPFDADARAWRDAMLDVGRAAAEIADARSPEERVREEAAGALGRDDRLRTAIARIQSQRAQLVRDLSRDRHTEASRRLREMSESRARVREVQQLQNGLSAMEGAMQALESEQARERLRLAMQEVERALHEVQARVDTFRVPEEAETRARLEAMATRSQEALQALEARTRALSEQRTQEIQTRIEESEVRMAAIRRALEARLERAEAWLLELIRRVR